MAVSHHRKTILTSGAKENYHQESHNSQCYIISKYSGNCSQPENECVQMTRKAKVWRR